MQSTLQRGRFADLRTKHSAVSQLAQNDIFQCHVLDPVSTVLLFEGSRSNNTIPYELIFPGQFFPQPF